MCICVQLHYLQSVIFYFHMEDGEVEANNITQHFVYIVVYLWSCYILHVFPTTQNQWNEEAHAVWLLTSLLFLTYVTSYTVLILISLLRPLSLYISLPPLSRDCS